MNHVPTDNPAPADGSVDELAAALGELLGRDQVHVAAEELSFYAHDMFSEGEPPACVVVVPRRELVAEVLKICTDRNFVVIPRGGGLSYSGGYHAIGPRSVVIDLSRLNAILEINKADMYVTVEVGCTWKQVYEALSAVGLRTPYFGPISGGGSTVGGALSQGSIYWGAAAHGTTAETVLGLEVALADGSTVVTGSGGGMQAPTPFFRTYGPDLTGLFLNDTGALGFKLSATLRLIALPKVTRFLSFAYDNYAQMIDAMSEIGRQGLASECLGVDANVFGQRLKRESLRADLGYLAGVVKMGNTRLEGLVGAARIVLAGRKVFDDVAYALHTTIAADDVTTAARLMRRARAICRTHGREIPASFPRAARGNPFQTGNGTLNQAGKRYIPTHGIAPHSRVLAVTQQVYAFMERYDEDMKRLDVEWGWITAVIARTGIIIEPLIYWGDSPSIYHRRMVDAAFLAKLPRHEHSPERNALIVTLRSGLKEIFVANGCVHLQIGKSYPYREGLAPANISLLEGVKSLLDPKRLINPGSLGLS